MRQYELAIRIAQVHHLVDERKYKKALAVIQTLDMRQVRSLSDLKVFAEVYTRTEQFDAAKATYLRIYRRSQTRRVLHRLIYLSIRTDALDEAEMYYQEFVRTNPNERDALIMRYRIDKARGVPIGRLIEILQDLKQEEYIEEWAYELAKLYHRAGRREECIAECEDILLWFGTGEIVERAKILIDHLEERDPIPYYDDKDFTEPRKEEPNPDDTGSLPDLNEFIKKRKAQKKGERLAESVSRREEKLSARQEEKKAEKEKEEPKPVLDKEKLPEADEELEKEIDRQLESYDEEDEMDRELSLKAAKKAQAEQVEGDGPVKEDTAGTAPEDFIDDYQEDESFEDIDFPKKAMDGIQKLLKFGKKEEEREKDKNKENQEKEREEPGKAKAEEKPKAPVPSANAGGEREYVPHSQSGTGITQDLAREISAIYEMEQKEQLQEKGVTVINDAPSNIATDLVERMNQALQNAPKKYIPLDVEEISGQEGEVLEGDTKDLSKDTDAWVDEAVTKDLSRHSAALNRQEKKEIRHKQPLRREAFEKNSAKDARERLKNIVENRREQREDVAGEETAVNKARLAKMQLPQELDGEAVESEVNRSVLPENRIQVSEEFLADTAADVTEERAGLPREFLMDTVVGMAEDAEEQPRLAGEPGEFPADGAIGGEEEQPGIVGESEEFPADEAIGGEEEQPGIVGEPEEFPADEAIGEEEEQPGIVGESGEFPADGAISEEEGQPGLAGESREFPVGEAIGGAGDAQEQPEIAEMPVEPLADAIADSMEEPAADEKLLRQLLEGEVEEPDELSELSEGKTAPSIEQEVLDEFLGDAAGPSVLTAGSEAETVGPENFGKAVFHSVEPQVVGAEPEAEAVEQETSGEAAFHSVEPQVAGAEPEAEDVEQETSGEDAFHSVKPQTLDLGLEEQLKAELEELEEELGRKELSEEENYGGLVTGGQELESAREEPASVQEVEPSGEEPASVQEVEPSGEEPASAQEVEPSGEEPASVQEVELSREETAFEQEPEPSGEKISHFQEPERPQGGAAYEREAELPKGESAYNQEAGLSGEGGVYGQEPEPVEEEPAYTQEAAREDSGHGREPELPKGEPIYGQRPGEQPEPARNQQRVRERREAAEEPVNRLSREMAAYRAPKIPVVETEYMEMPEITYDDLPTTRALQESFNYVLQLIEGELEPSHFVLMGDGTERIVGVAKRIVRVMKNCGYISRGRIAKIHARQLNKMDLISFRSQLFGNCLLIDGAADLLFPTITRIFSIMEEYQGNFVVILADEGTTLDQLFRFVPALAKRFQYIIDISKYTKEDYE